MGGAPPPQGSELVGDVGDVTPHGSAGAAPQGPEAAGAGIEGGGEGPAELKGAAAPAAPQGSLALSSIREPCAENILSINAPKAVFRKKSKDTFTPRCRG